MTSKSKVYFFFDKTKIVLKDRLRLKSVIGTLFKKEKKELLSLNFIFCTDETLLRINQQFLNHDFYTDIVTFSYSGNKNHIVGEAYISVNRVRENATNLKTSIGEELLRVIFHGALHLCGYGDKSTSATKKMRDKENFYIAMMKNRST